MVYQHSLTAELYVKNNDALMSNSWFCNSRQNNFHKIFVVIKLIRNYVVYRAKNWHGC